MDLNLVRVLVAVFEARSVTLAADRLGLAQPSVSHALSRLREYYGDQLFMRRPDGMAPTALCEGVYPGLSQSLASIEATLDAALDFVPARSNRQFRLAMSDIGALYFSPPLLRHLQVLAPHAQIEIVQPSVSLAEDLASGKVDFAVGNMPELAASTHSSPLFHERYVCLMAKDHPTIRGKLSVEKFAQARQVLVTSPSSGHTMIDQLLGEHKVQRDIVARVPQFSVIPYLVANTDLLVILPLRVGRLFVAQGGSSWLKFRCASRASRCAPTGMHVTSETRDTGGFVNS
jgi:DNA-binding transcriptional LysR family regulator